MLMLGGRSRRALQLSRGLGYMNGVCVGADSLPLLLFYVWDGLGWLHSCYGEIEMLDKGPLLEQGAV